MMRDGRDGKPKSGNMMRALAVRVALVDACCSPCILLGYWLGWIQPTGVPLGKLSRRVQDEAPLDAALHFGSVACRCAHSQ